MSDIQLDKDRSRFTLEVEGTTSVLEFSVDGKVASFNSVRVPDAVGGRGIAGQLTRHALDWARSSDMKVRPVCPYVAKWIERHPEYQELVDG